VAHGVPETRTRQGPADAWAAAGRSHSRRRGANASLFPPTSGEQSQCDFDHTANGDPPSSATLLPVTCMKTAKRGQTVGLRREGAMTMTEQPATPAKEKTARCAHHDGHGPGGGAEAPESPRERVNRRWNEVLQETRVTQTGVQILFGFLLSVAFTPLFRELGTVDRAIYVATVVLGASATGALIAPVSIHRFLSGQRMKNEVVEAACRLMTCGMVLLALTIGCTLLLILRFVVPGVLAEVLVVGVMLWFGLCWYVLPLRIRRRAARRSADDEA